MSYAPSLSQPLRDLLTSEMEAGERLQWCGQPSPRVNLSWLSVPLFLFAVPWTIFSLTWIAGAAGMFGGNGRLHPERLLFALVGVPFMLVGIALLLVPRILRRSAARAAENTLYVITDRRAIVVNGGYYGPGLSATLVGAVMRVGTQGIKVQSFAADQLTHIERIQRADGSGDVIFGLPEFAISNEAGDRRRIFRAGFYSIDDVHNVENLLKKLAARPEAE